VVLPLAGWKVAGSRWPVFLGLVVAVAAVTDVIAMPMLDPVLVLDDGWWIGEGLLLAGVLAPGALALWWTERRVCLPGRVVLQGAAIGVLLLGVVPCVAEGGSEWVMYGLGKPWWVSVSLGTLAAGFAVLGIVAAREFVLVGRGTPLPFDPTQHLVTSGVYRWVANPMQVSMMGMCVVWWLWFGSWWMLGLAALGVVYSEGLARWSEREDQLERFGEEWTAYRAKVRRWWPRWRRG
jgi:protein-S-isoprenylcysteine O-methyltransferase Ste14